MNNNNVVIGTGGRVDVKLYCQSDLKQCHVKKLDESPKNIIDVAKKINWLHGTNSSILSIIPYTDYTLIPTGKLLQRGIAPMCGEISCGGLSKANAVNQKYLSVETIEGITRCADYANNVSYSSKSNAPKEGYVSVKTGTPFIPEEWSDKFINAGVKTGIIRERSIQESMEESFLEGIKLFQSITPDSANWDPELIKLYQLKQWEPDIFMALCEKHRDKINAIYEAIKQKHSSKEMIVLKALKYDTEKLMNAINDDNVREEVEADFPYLKQFNKSWTNGSVSQYFFSLISPLIYPSKEEYDDGGWNYTFHLDYQKNYKNILSLKMFGQAYIDNIKNHYYSYMNGDEVRGESHKKYIFEIYSQIQKYAGSDNPQIEVLLENTVRPKLEALMKNNAFPYTQRMERLEHLFNDKPIVYLGEEDKENLKDPYPLLLASTKQKSIPYSGGSENHINHAKLGRDVDIVFVKDEYKEKFQQWLHDHQLSDQVSVFSFSKVKEIKNANLKHSDDQVENRVNFVDEYKLPSVNNIINKHVVPIYSSPYKDGSHRKWHGVMHAMRTSLFSHIIASMYQREGVDIKFDSGNVMIAAAMHDSARENDGVDYWDEQSGKMARQLLVENNLLVDDEEAEIIEKAVSEKDHENPATLEQKIVHDSDCIEILRCLYKDEDFRPQNLWILKDLEQDIAMGLIARCKGVYSVNRVSKNQEICGKFGRSSLKLVSNSEICL